MDKEQKFRTEFLLLCDKHDVSADAMTNDYMNEVYRLAEKELLIAENRLWVEKIISQNSDERIKTISENDFMGRIKELLK